MLQERRVRGKRGFWAIGLAVAACAACATGADNGAVTPDPSAVVDGGAADGPPQGTSPESGPGVDGASSPDTGTDPNVVEAGGDDSSADGGPSDTGTPDTGSQDTGSQDTGPSTCASQGYSGTLVTFSLVGQPGNEASAPGTPSTGGVSAGPLSRSGSLTATSGSGSINASGWSSGSSADPTRYYTVSITPAAGCTVAPTSLSFGVHTSPTGPTSGDVATSVDGFAAHVGAFATASSTQTIALSGVSGSGRIEVRVYGYGASGTGGTMRIDGSMTLSGSIH